MLKTHLTIAYRNFIRNKVFSLINALGFAIGISISLVIFLIVHYNFSFDKFQKDQPHLYQIVTKMNFFGSPIHNTESPSPLEDVLSKEVPGIADIISFHKFIRNPKMTTSPKNETSNSVECPSINP
jgi:hypothetical protein